MRQLTNAAIPKAALNGGSRASAITSDRDAAFEPIRGVAELIDSALRSDHWRVLRVACISMVLALGSTMA
jgi:hypothetical protein